MTARKTPRKPTLKAGKGTTKTPGRRASNGATVAPTPRLPRTPLSTVGHIRVALARVYRECRGGKLPTSEGAKLTYILNILRGVIEGSTLENRIQELERKAADLASRTNQRT